MRLGNGFGTYFHIIYTKDFCVNYVNRDAIESAYSEVEEDLKV